MRLKEKLLTSLLLVPLAGTTAVAKERGNFDAFLSRQDSRSLAASEAAIQSRGLRVEHFEERLGVPTVLWNARGEGQRTGALAGQAPEQAARAHLQQVADLYRLSSADVSSAVLENLHKQATGPVVARFSQKVNGVEVFRGDINVVMTRENDLVAITGNLAPREAVSAARASFQLAPADAIARAFSDLTDTVISGRSLVAAGTKGDYTHFGFEPGVGTVLPHAMATPARAKKIYFTLPDRLEPAYYLELNVGTKGSNDADYYSFVISATDGSLLFRNNLTVEDSFTYNVWADPVSLIPFDGPHGTEATPHPTGTPNRYQAPFIPPNVITLQNFPFSKDDPWLPNGATQTTGNNVDAYADLAAPDGFQAGGADIRPSTTSPGVFDYTYDVTKAPGTTPNQIKAATVSLFYLNNFLHDWFYDAGFDEASGNAQVSNYGRGGLEGDSIRAEAQDYSGRNNANMSTPADGQRPRMQMYVFNGVPEMKALAPANLAANLESGSASFGAQVFELTGDVLIPNPAGPTIACTPFAAGTNFNGKIVLLDRGSCDFNLKSKHAQDMGAIGTIIANNALNQPAPGLGGTNPAVTIPTLSISKETADAWRAAVAADASLVINVRMKRTPDLDRDGTIDNAIVAHEWGHYISNRLVANSAGLTNNQGRAMGEGWADFTAMLMAVKESDRNIAGNSQFQGVYAMAGYTQSGGANNGHYYGIRRVPLSTDMNKNALTFRHFANGSPLPTNHPMSTNALNGAGNSQVHNGGEVWSTMLWECYASLLNAYPFQEAQDRMKSYLVAGYKATPPAPTLLEARDALLAAAAAADPADYQRFLNAFAKRGAGLGAKAADRDSVDHIGVVESFVAGNNLEVVAMRLDDSTTGCDRDGVLDKGETGMFHVTVRNTGVAALQPFTATVAASGATATLAFPNGNTLNFGTLQPGATATRTVLAQLTDVSGTAPTAGLTVTFNEASLPASARTATYNRRVHYDEGISVSATESFETESTSWVSSPVNRWVPATANSTSRYIHVNNLAVVSDMVLVSPWIKVGATGDFVVSYKYRHSLEGTAGGSGLAAPFYDGVVLEVSTDGSTWEDVFPKYAANPTPVGYVAFLADAAAGNDNPLAGRAAYTGMSAGFPAWATATANFTNKLAGRDIRLRFRIASDSGASAYGFDLDDVSLTNASSMPFAGQQPEMSDGTTCNRRPVADVGLSRQVDERTEVILNGSASFDPDGSQLTYTWTQISGPAVTLTDANTAMAKFTTEVSRNTMLGFQLVVSDGTESSMPKVTEILVTNINRKPVAMAKVASATAPERGDAVTLSGADSTDADNETLTYKWVQRSGPAVTLSSDTVASPTFAVPEVTADTQLSFELVVNDGIENSAASTVAVTVTNVDRAPTANAGVDAQVDARSTVTLQGSGSDADGDSLTYAWTVAQAPQDTTITLNDANTATPSFTAPDVRTSTPATVVLQLVTTANGVSSTPDTVTITVKKANRRPVGQGPANFTENEGTAITLDATPSTDPDGDTLSYSWTQTGGPLVTLNGQTTARLQFTTPEVLANTLMTFVLVVKDADGAEADAVPVSVTVRQVNKAPMVSPRKQTAANLSDKTVTLVAGAADPDGDALTYKWEQSKGANVTLSSSTTDTVTFQLPTVETTTQLVFKVTATDAAGLATTGEVEVLAIGTPKPTENDGGGCSSTGNASGGLMLLAALAGVLLSRRRGVIG
ncbi:MAG TPA: myxosortase-dependent M36 family metallopeptidase [Myxococcaceae bacterium]|nr:myxosortase-dependent M36 family metallopeptidase [Myxococcaceae bacterium]